MEKEKPSAYEYDDRLDYLLDLKEYYELELVLLRERFLKCEGNLEITKINIRQYEKYVVES